MGRHTNKTTQWEHRNYWIFPTMSLLFLAPLAFSVMAGRTRCIKWLIEGSLYFLLFLSIFALVGREWIEPVPIVFFSTYGVSVLRSIWIRREYLQRLEALEDGREYCSPRKRRKMQQNEADPQPSEITLSGWVPKRIPDPTPAEVAETVPKKPFSVEKELEMTDPETQKPDHLDINRCTPDQLAELPGITIITAKKAINHREEIHGYDHIDDFFDYLSIKPHFREQLEPLLTCSKSSSPARSGRGHKIDL